MVPATLIVFTSQYAFFRSSRTFCASADMVPGNLAGAVVGAVDGAVVGLGDGTSLLSNSDAAGFSVLGASGSSALNVGAIVIVARKSAA